MDYEPLFLASMMDPASSQAEHITTLTWYFFLAAGFIMAVVTGLTIYTLIRFRKAKNPEPHQIKNNTTTELFMIGIPTAMVVVFFYLTVKGMNDIMPPAENKQVDVIITGHQWWWEAYYPAADVTVANEIHLPVNKTLLLEMKSADVIHDWWVPELGNKIDLVPGRINHLWLKIHTPGKYIGACSEFCGDQHAWMRINVFAKKQDQFEEWLSEHKIKANVPHDSLAIAGSQIFQQKTCANCHRIKGTPANGDTGPDLTHLASRETLLTGKLKNTSENLKEWLNNPQKIKPGAHMPDFILDPKSLDALTAYLSTLK